jgi:hypothetical protein
MAELKFKSACELTALIRKRELKPSEAVAHALARVEALNGKLNAFCAMRAERAMAEARAMDERIARREEVGALAGVPIGVKDLEEVAGMATTFGSQAFRDNLATEDAIEVARLRGRGRNRDRQDQHARVRPQRVHPQPALRPDAQSMEPRTHAGRILGRQRGGGGERDGSDRDRVGRRRIDPAARGVYGMRRTQTVAWQDSGWAADGDGVVQRHLVGRADRAHGCRRRPLP